MDKKIALASIIMAVIGLVLELFPSFGTQNLYYFWYLAALVIDEQSFGGVKVGVFFYLLLLTGGIIHIVNRKGHRLISYFFSMVFFFKSVSIYWIVKVFLVEYKILVEYNLIEIKLTGFIFYSAWVFLSYIILKHFRKTANVESIPSKNEVNVQLNIIVEATKGKRFLNRLTDLITILLILVPFIQVIYMNQALWGISNQEGLVESLMPYTYPILLEILYYFVFESIFQTTPGKLLTGTRVVTEVGEKPVTTKILLRTICRFLPFEAISALFGNPWHDRLSETYVVNERRKEIEETDVLEDDDASQMNTIINGIK